MRPASTTITRSAISTVVRRWAMITAVRSSSSVRSACCTRRSEGTSSDEVASSRISTAGSARKARAKRHELALPGREPRALLVDVGVVALGQAADELVGADGPGGAPRSRPSAAPGRPRRMLSATEPANRKLSWVTVMTARRRSASVRSRRSTPSSSTRPSVGSQKRAARRATVVLPAPVAPTTASVWPAGIARSRWCRTGALAVAELDARRSGPRRAASASGVGLDRLGHARRLGQHAGELLEWPRPPPGTGCRTG